MDSTTRKQSERLLAVGFPKVGLGLRGHTVVVEPVSLGTLWDAVQEIGTWYEFRNDLTSNELIEALVRILEDHYGSRKNGDRAL